MARYEDEIDRERGWKKVIDAAQLKVRGPAMGMLILAALCLLGIAGPYFLIPSKADAKRDLAKQREETIRTAPPQQGPELVKLYDFTSKCYDFFFKYFQPIYYGLMAIQVLIYFAAGYSLVNFNGRTLPIIGALTAITSSLLCVNGCCLIALPIGIWTFTVLNDKIVRSALQAVGDGRVDKNGNYLGTSGPSSDESFR